MPPICFGCKNAGNWAGVRKDLQQLLLGDGYGFLLAKKYPLMTGCKSDGKSTYHAAKYQPQKTNNAK